MAIVLNIQIWILFSVVSIISHCFIFDNLNVFYSPKSIIKF